MLQEHLLLVVTVTGGTSGGSGTIDSFDSDRGLLKIKSCNRYILIKRNINISIRLVHVHLKN